MKNRIITGSLIALVCIPFLLFGGTLFKIGASLIILVAAHELLHLRKDRQYSVITQFIVYSLAFTSIIFDFDFFNASIASFSTIILVVFSIMIFDKNTDFNDISYILSILLFVLLAGNCALYIRGLDNGLSILMFIVIVTSANDIGAYFVGKNFGRQKLIERISPNKTVEGSIGGLLSGLTIGLIYATFLPIGPEFQQLWQITLACILLSILGQMGDLFFSAIKRTYDAKDFSNILPGHGGVLDRLDSHLSNFIGYVVLITILSSI